jgi:hypothetical protein
VYIEDGAIILENVWLEKFRIEFVNLTYRQETRIFAHAVKME